jgi:hypothetical protein
MIKVLYKPLSILISVFSGILAGAILMMPRAICR